MNVTYIAIIRLICSAAANLTGDRDTSPALNFARFVADYQK